MARAFRKAIALTVAVGLSGAAHSHEFVAKPAAFTVQQGAELQVAGLSTHVFLISQELEAPKDVKVGFYAAGKRTDIAVKPNEMTLTYDGTVTAPSNTTFIVTGARLPQIWATTPEGLKQTTERLRAPPTLTKSRNSPRHWSTSHPPTTVFPPSSATHWKSCPSQIRRRSNQAMK